MAKKTVNCEIQKIFPFNADYGKTKVSMKPKQEKEDIIESNGYDKQYNNFSINIKSETLPEWCVQGNNIELPYQIYMGYVTINNFEEVKVLNSSTVVEDIKEAFPDATLEELPDSLDEEETDFNFGANKKKLNGHSTLSEEKKDFAAQYLSDYEAIGKIGKPDFDLTKLDERNYKDVITGCKIAMTQKFGN